MNIRQAKRADANRLLNIYKPEVENIASSFELTPPDAYEFSRRIASCISSYEWLVMEDANCLAGYAYATPHRASGAYKHAVETTVYIHSDYRREGVGKKLYEALFVSLQSRDFHNAYAGKTLPNEASIALHKSIHFEPIGIFREIGFKFGDWHDVS